MLLRDFVFLGCFNPKNYVGHSNNKNYVHETKSTKDNPLDYLDVLGNKLRRHNLGAIAENRNQSSQNKSRYSFLLSTFAISNESS